MDQSDFDNWLADFGVRFSTRATWLRKNPETVATWPDVLGSVELVDAIAANREAQQTGAFDDASWDSIPAIIKRLAGEQRANRIADQREHEPDGLHGRNPTRCGQCRDGLIDVWHPTTIRGFAGFETSTARLRIGGRWENREVPTRKGGRVREYTVGVPCKCPDGKKFPTRSKDGERDLTYDPKRHCKVIDGESAEVTVKRWLEARGGPWAGKQAAQADLPF